MLWCPPSENTKQHKENKQDLASNVLDGVQQLNTFKLKLGCYYLQPNTQQTQQPHTDHEHLTIYKRICLRPLTQYPPKLCSS